MWSSYSGVVYKDIDVSCFLLYLFDDGGDGGGIGNVALEGYDGGFRGRSDGVRSFLQFVETATEEVYF